MSHLKERVEKNCLNCNAQVEGKYCSICGQENTSPKESAGHLVSHYFQDITHFDGKFFSSIRLLIFKPGFLSTQYIRGKRSTYLNPIRMYVFTSAFFFLIFFSFVQKDKEVEIETPVSLTDITNKVEKDKTLLVNKLATEKDSVKIKQQKNRLADLDKVIAALKNIPSVKDTSKTGKSSTKLSLLSTEITSIKIYDSIQKKLPLSERDNWLTKKIQYKIIEVKNKYKDDPDKIMTAVLHKFKHSFPQLLFLSLPFFALVLKILYSRQKQLYYVNHVIFTIHLYCAIFILLLLIFSFDGLASSLHWAIFSWLSTILSFAIIFYQYKALRNFYQQKWFKTMAKFFILGSAMVFIFIFLAAILLTFSAYQI